MGAPQSPLPNLNENQDIVHGDQIITVGNSNEAKENGKLMCTMLNVSQWEMRI